MNNVSRLLLKRAEKAERVLAIMVEANDKIEAICDDEIGRLSARVTELEAYLKESQDELNKLMEARLDTEHSLHWKDWEEQEARERNDQIDEEASEKESRRLQAYDREQFYRDLDERSGEVPGE